MYKMKTDKWMKDVWILSLNLSKIYVYSCYLHLNCQLALKPTVFISNHHCSVQNAWFISWNHVLDVDKSILTTMHFKQLQCLLDQISQILMFSLAVINFVSKILVFSFEQVHNWKDLSVVRNQCFSNCVWTSYQSLQDLKSDSNDLWISCVQCCLNRDNKLWNNRKNFCSTLFKHVKHSLDWEESVRISLLSDSLEKDWQVMVIVKLLNINFPWNLVLWTVFNANGKVASVVEQSKFTSWNFSSVTSTSNWFLLRWLCLSYIQANWFSTRSISFFEDACSFVCNWNFIEILRFLCKSCRWIFASFWNRLHIITWKIAKGWVWISWKILVIVLLPSFTRSHGETFLEMIFKNHLTRRLRSCVSVLCLVHFQLIMKYII